MSSATRVLSHVVRSRELAVAVVLVALVVVTTLRNDNFLFSPDGWRNLLLNPSMLLILAVGQTAVIITLLRRDSGKNSRTSVRAKIPPASRITSISMLTSTRLLTLKRASDID